MPTKYASEYFSCSLRGTTYPNTVRPSNLRSTLLRRISKPG